MMQHSAEKQVYSEFKKKVIFGFCIRPNFFYTSITIIHMYLHCSPLLLDVCVALMCATCLPVFSVCPPSFVAGWCSTVKNTIRTNWNVEIFSVTR